MWHVVAGLSELGNFGGAQLPAIELALGTCAEVSFEEECKKLEAFVHCSTSYTAPAMAYADDRPIREEPHKIFSEDAQQIYDRILGGVTTEEENEMLQASGHPNTYTYTKCVAEQILSDNRGDVPLVLVRPSIVSASMSYPKPGWIDSKAAFKRVQQSEKPALLTL